MFLMRIQQDSDNSIIPLSTPLPLTTEFSKWFLMTFLKRKQMSQPLRPIGPQPSLPKKQDEKTEKKKDKDEEERRTPAINEGLEDMSGRDVSQNPINVALDQ